MEDRGGGLPRDYGLATLRHVQWLFALISHFLFVGVFSHVRRTSLGLDDRVKAVPWMNTATLVYATVVVVGVHLIGRFRLNTRYILECLTIGWDLWAAGLFVAKGAILNSTRLDCQVLLEEKFLSYGMTRQTFQSLESAVGFGFRVGIDEIDRQCGASLFIYWISIVAVISYSLSVVMTLVRAREYRRLLLRAKKDERPDRVEMEIEVPRVAGIVSSTSSFRSPAYPNGGRSRSQDRQAVLDFVPVTHRPRSSQETTSSCGADAFLVTDGFRPADEPPAYASRPASVYSVKGD